MNLNWSYSPETVKLGVDLCDLELWPLTLTFCMDVTFVIGNNCWKFHDDAMMGTWWKRCDGQTDGRTDGRTDRRTDWTSHIAAWSQLKMYLYSFQNVNIFFKTPWLRHEINTLPTAIQRPPMGIPTDICCMDLRCFLCYYPEQDFEKKIWSYGQFHAPRHFCDVTELLWKGDLQ